MFAFANRNALIFGAAKGIGRATAGEFCRRGARLAIADLNMEAARETAQSLVDSGAEAVAIPCDVGCELSVREAAVSAEQALGDIDIVMNNVGGLLHGQLEDVPLAEWERILSINLLSVARSSAIFVPKMIRRGSGYIVNVGSFAGLYPFATTRMPYVAAKAAVLALSESMAIYLKPQGVHVSCLCPGPVRTNVLDGMKTWTANLEMRGPGSTLRLKSAEEVAALLADGMCEAKVIIPTDDAVWEIMRQHVADPDTFIQKKIDEFASGDMGRPAR
ncbi:MAG: SDR family NAD(P)-dependent oxidoreductase [Halieaceae bacterium]|nr:SDR family NAD(P)-dependent oxidoreductase [Halieaceae bacterium]